jgi:hypothetical protein
MAISAKASHDTSIALEAFYRDRPLFPVIGDTPILNAAELWEQLHDGVGCYTLSTTRLPYNAECTCFLHREGNITQCFVAPLIGIKIDT